VANILTRRARKSDLVARLGGDEFTVLLYDTDPKLVENVADSLPPAARGLFLQLRGKVGHHRCSIGVAMIEPAVASPTETMSRADLACHPCQAWRTQPGTCVRPEDAKNVYHHDPRHGLVAAHPRGDRTQPLPRSPASRS